MNKRLGKKKSCILIGIFLLIIVSVAYIIMSAVKGNSKASGVVYDGIYLEYKDDIEEKYFMYGTFPDYLYEKQEEIRRRREEKQKENKDKENKNEEGKNNNEKEEKSLEELVYAAYFKRIKINECTFRIENNTFKWTGDEVTPKIYVNYYDKVLNNSEYSVIYYNNVHSGTACAKITGNGRYRGTVKLNFEIEGIDIVENCKFKIEDEKVIMTYDGKVVDPSEYRVNVYHTDVLVSKGKVKREFTRTTHYEVKGMGRFKGTYELKTQENIEDITM